jgi:hypothetical protein
MFVRIYFMHCRRVTACCDGVYTPLYDSKFVILSAAAAVEPPKVALHAYTGAQLLPVQCLIVVQHPDFPLLR